MDTDNYFLNPLMFHLFSATVYDDNKKTQELIKQKHICNASHCVTYLTLKKKYIYSAGCLKKCLSDALWPFLP